MPDLTRITPSAISIPSPELREATVLDDATEVGQAVRCVVPSLDSNLATDPLAWTPVTTATGEYWPRSGERALLAYHQDGPPVIVFWEPGEREADAAVGSDALGVIVHGSDSSVARGKGHSHYVWIGDVEPENAVLYDLLTKYG